MSKKEINRNGLQLCIIKNCDKITATIVNSSFLINSIGKTEEEAIDKVIESYNLFYNTVQNND